MGKIHFGLAETRETHAHGPLPGWLLPFLEKRITSELRLAGIVFLVLSEEERKHLAIKAAGTFAAAEPQSAAAPGR